MPDLVILPVALSGGLNDSVSEPQPGDFQQLENFAIYRGRIGLRAPVIQTVNITDVTIASILAGTFHRDKFYVMAYQTSGGNARLYELDTDGTNAVFKTNVWTGLGAPPKPILASFDGGSATAPTTRLYIADWDQQNDTKTWRDGTTLTAEQEDLDDSGAKENLRFHYVFTYNYHVFGAGFLQGTIVRPELLRVTRPGVIPEVEPFVVNNTSREWWSVDQLPIGVRGEKIYAHGYAGGSAIVFKKRKTYVLSGYDYQSFTLKILSDKVGATGRNAVCWTDDGLCFFWSERGLMVTDGNSITDLSEPIRNHVAQVTDVESVKLEYSSDDGQVYVFYTKVGDTSPKSVLAFDKVRGKYWEATYTGSSPLSVGAAMGIPSLVLQGPAGAPSSLTGAAVDHDSISLLWTNGDTALDTVTEIYRGLATAPTTLVHTALSGVAARVDNGDGSALSSITTYYYRLRHKRNGIFSSYSNEVNFKTWLKPPASLSATQIVNGNKVTLTNNEASADIEIERKLTSGSTWSVITTLTNQSTGVKTYDDTTATCGTSYDYRARTKKSGEHESVYSNESTSVACGGTPDITNAFFNWFGGCGGDNVEINWTGTGFSAGDTCKIYQNDNGGGYLLRDTVPIQDQSYIDTWPYDTGATPRTLRYKLEAWEDGTVLKDTFEMNEQALDSSAASC